MEKWRDVALVMICESFTAAESWNSHVLIDYERSFSLDGILIELALPSTSVHPSDSSPCLMFEYSIECEFK
jgi:hypothetical protein